MTTITTRLGKGSPLTATEHDANLNNLNNDKSEDSSNIISKSSDYTITITDLDKYSHLIVLVDISSSNITITLPTASDYEGKVINIVVNVTGAFYRLIVTSDVEPINFYHGYRLRDFLSITSDGTSRIVLDELVTVKGYLSKSADLSVSAATSADGYSANYTEVEDVGSWFNSDTLTTEFKCQIEIEYRTVGHNDLVSNLKVDGAFVQDNIGVTTNATDRSSYRMIVEANKEIKFFVYNANSGTARSLYGDAALDESQVHWYVIRRLRE